MLLNRSERAFAETSCDDSEPLSTLMRLMSSPDAFTECIIVSVRRYAHACRSSRLGRPTKTDPAIDFFIVKYPH